MDRGDIFDILPASVRSRIPAFRSSRWSRRLSVISPQHHQVSRQISEELVVTGPEGKGILRVDGTTGEAGMEATTRHRKTIRPASGIRWRYAEQGMSMHRSAHLEKEDAGFARKSYVDGVAYMLMALPEDLTEQEAAVVRGALPPSIADTSLLDSRSGGGGGGPIGWKPHPENRTVLQRCVACLVAVFVVLLHWGLSCATVVVRVGAHYERKHNISQQIASWGFVVATAVGRHGIVLSAKICAMKDGRVGKAVSCIANWTVEGVAYGIQEGIGQGLVMTDMKSKQA